CQWQRLLPSSPMMIPVSLMILHSAGVRFVLRALIPSLPFANRLSKPNGKDRFMKSRPAG
ncbi:hypothetical protein, partial [Rhizobium johnstonii]|uniref:hypothetical protein n=1 Tax=Rhizobium johnstonii TaxID=3019933 RepID=UPI003F991078